MTEIEKLKILLTKRKYTAKTIESYVGWITRLSDYYHNTSLESLSAEDLNAFIMFLGKQKQLSHITMRAATSALRFFYSEVLNKKEISSLIKIIRGSRSQNTVPLQSEIIKTINHIKNDELKLIIQFIYGMGLELQDAISIKVKDVQIEQGFVEIKATRAKITRRALIPFACIDSIKNIYSKKGKADFLFSNKDGSPFSDSKIQRALVAARQSANTSTDITVRALRSAYISHLVFLGVPLITILDNLGINTKNTLAHYSLLTHQEKEITITPLDILVNDGQNSPKSQFHEYVSTSRINDLMKIKSNKFDFSKLVSLLAELNSAAQNGNLYTIALIVRAIIDHVPPVFNDAQSFSQVCSNYGGTKSFKQAIEALNTHLRTTADAYLHSHIRKKEDKPTLQRIDFRAPLDNLLGEIIRIS